MFNYVQRHYGSDEKETCVYVFHLFIFFTVSDLRCHLRKGPLSRFMVVQRVERSPEPEGQPVLECLLEVTSVLGRKLEALQAVSCWR